MGDRDILEKALTFFDGGENWTTDEYLRWTGEDAEKATACIMGALLLAEGNEPPAVEFWDLDNRDRIPCTSIIAEIIREKHRDRVFSITDDHDTIAQFNDHMRTTWADVEEVLQLAIKREIQKEEKVNGG